MCDCRVCRGPIRAGVRVKYNFNTSRVEMIGFLRQLKTNYNVLCVQELTRTFYSFAYLSPALSPACLQSSRRIPTGGEAALEALCCSSRLVSVLLAVITTRL